MQGDTKQAHEPTQEQGGASHRMVLRRPAIRWQDALPTGNGSMGALVYGGIHQETIVLNHEGWWYGSVTPPLPKIAGSLPELRRLLSEGRYREANVLFPDLLRQDGYNAPCGMFQPGVDLRISTTTKGAFSNYSRSVDFASGQVAVEWTDSGISFQRLVFASRPDGVIVMTLRGSSPGAVTAAFSLEPRDWRDSLLKGMKQEEIPFTHESRASREAGGDFLQIVGKRHDGSTFAAVARVVAPGGAALVVGNGVQVESADEITVLVKLAIDGQAALEFAKASLAAITPDYAAILDKHAVEHTSMYRGVQLELPGECSVQTVNEQLLLDSYNGHVAPAILGKMFNFGRYLLISSSRPGGLPANLQGVWNGDFNPAWNSAFFNNENIQMNYWQALPGNLAQTLLPLFELYESLLEDYRTNARHFFGCRGILIPLFLAPDSGLKKNLQSHVVYWTAGGGWIGQLFFEYWRFTGDDAFLAGHAVPWLREVALFYEDFLVEGPGGVYRVMPSNSPENCALGSFDGAGELPISINATMDFAVAKETLTNLIAACEHLKIESENVVRWRRMLSKIPPYQVNADGAIREWMHPDFLDNYRHRHISHIYPVYPATEITRTGSPEIFNACRTAVEKRLVVGLKDQAGWSLAHLSNIYARLGEGNRALECLELMSRSCLGDNFFAYHNDWRRQGVTLDFDYHGRGAPFQIDANFGWTSAMLEMLLFSLPGEIAILPALPDKWTTGSVRGLRCRGAVEAAVTWDLGRGIIQAELKADRSQRVTVRWPAAIRSLKVNGRRQKATAAQEQVISLEARITTVLQVRLAGATGTASARRPKKARSLRAQVLAGATDTIN